MHVFAVPDVPEIDPGTDLAAVITDRVNLEPGDVVLVASTVVSKAEGRYADFSDYEPSGRAVALAARHEAITGDPKNPRFAQAILEESRDVLIEDPFVLAETRFGHITVNAGIDRSNVKDHDLLLLPENPAESAARIHEALGIPVIVTDTSGRPFRVGQRGVAVGWAGMAACRDWRGETDRYGRELGVTVQCVVDELAGTANLVAGEGDGGTPVVVVRDWAFGDHTEHDVLFRGEENDVVRAALKQWRFDDP